jgi:hypothetical protein
MEIILPTLTLGGLYMISKNQKKKNNQEGFTDKNVPDVNYPTTKYSKTVSDFKDPNAPVDQFYEPQVYEEQANEDTNSYESLTGEKVEKNQFTHNNMQPFFGSTVKQRSYKTDDQSILDNKVGHGSHMYKKKEVAPLFKPEENMHWNHGMPNHSDFVQSRMNPSARMANVKPFEEIRVGPGLGNGFDCQGSGGFNSALEARNEWQPRTVDELRTANNQKKTFRGVTLGGKHFNGVRGIEGKLEKNLPEKFFVQNRDRFLVTTGAELRPTGRSEQMLGNSNRIDTTQEYYGPGGNQKDNVATYVDGEYHEPHRIPLPADVTQLRNMHVKSGYDATDSDFGVKGYKPLPNERSLTGETSFFGAVSTIAKEVILPLQDLLRPSRKENFIGNVRPTGNAKPEVGNRPMAYTDQQKVTKKEMMIDNDFGFNVGAQHLGGYGHLTNPQQVAHTQRATTGDIQDLPGAQGNGAVQLNQSYAGNYNSKIGDYKETTLTGRINQGNTDTFNNYQHLTSMGEEQRYQHIRAPHSNVKAPPSLQTYGEYNDRNVKGQTIMCGRNNDSNVQVLAQNPLSKPIGSLA